MMFRDLIKKEYEHINEELEFFVYVWDFYGEDGLYPIKGLKVDEIITAIQFRKLCLSDINYDGDSWDRELVRDYIYQII